MKLGMNIGSHNSQKVLLWKSKTKLMLEATIAFAFQFSAISNASMATCGHLRRK
jgi:hypothetical protein